MVVIGLEIHTALATKSKLFCNCSTDITKAEPNTVCCPICCGFPGSKPMVNKKAIEFGIMVAKALNCRINQEFFFSRKSYFYPDMPKNYQISQFEIPLANDGYLEVMDKKIRIRRIQFEEDPGKLIHVGGDITSAQYVLVDYNRSGIPLLEIVTEPDFTSTKEVREFLRKLSSILEHLEVYDPYREGGLRVDANISIEGGERVELKNVTGFANVEKALNYEIVRQSNLLRMGRKVERETRHFDADTGMTATLRRKEFEEDYGFILDPDLTMIELDTEWVKELEKKMPELPDQRIGRFVKEYRIPERDAKVIVYVDKALADFFEACCKLYRKPKEVARWVVTDLLKCLNWNDITIRESKVRPETFVELLKLIEKEEITERLAKEIIKEYVPTGKSPKEIIKEKKLGKIAGKDLEKIVEDVLKENEKAVEEYRSGREKALQFLIGQVLRKTEARADPILVGKLIKKMI
jgi:aspartyl-tRNA(Asn)/glutamyl-tRNA(Gln) amidotransferase subunit B